MTARLAFVDCETSGLDPSRHEIWELAVITVPPWDADANPGGWCEFEWQLPVDLAKADPTGLRVGRFYERRRQLPSLEEGMHAGEALVRWPNGAAWEKRSVAAVARDVAHLLDGAHLVGAVPSFDAAFLAPWLNAHGQAATWNYHLIDCEALAAGYLRALAGVQRDGMVGEHASSLLVSELAPVAWQETALPPWDSNELSLAVGVDPEKFDRHTALGDARWARAIAEAVMGDAT